jgi:rubrerythrin
VTIQVELGTFGAIIKFALDIENAASAFYESAIKIITNQTLTDLFEKFYQRKQKRIQLLTRVRRENITETILEHITGLTSDDYELIPPPSSDIGEQELCHLAVKMEGIALEFYNVAAIKIGFLYEAADAFERLSEENNENKEKLLASL